LFTRPTALAFAAMGLLALVLTARQWDVFVASFLDTLSPGGLVGYLLALAVAKSIHELGHALTATRYGLRVAHMGVAFLVMWPMLYTDTGESWRLSERKQRLAIASAGIISELALAILATLAWNLTDDGDARQALFFLATTAWLVSLLLNASPFMRFDGYFILSDALDMPNLHERSFALARTAMRRRLLGWHDPDPEPFAPVRRRALIAFAYGVWIYRLIAFTGIALAVYFMFFKLLGIILFAVEIVVFVLRPIWNELKVWHARQDEITAYRKRAAALTLLALLLIALLPWSTRLTAPGWAHPGAQHVFYSPLPARLDAMPQAGTHFAAGAPVFRLDQPELDYRARQAQFSSAALDLQMRGLSGLNDGEEKRASLMSQLAMQEAQLYAQTDEAARLTLKAPFAGTLVDIDPELDKEVWVNPRQPLAMLVAAGQWQADILVEQKDLPRIRQQARVRFYPENKHLAPIDGRVSAIDTTRSVQLPHPMLSSRHGGPVAVLPDQGGLHARDALYRVRVQLDGAPGQMATLRGQAVIDAPAQSWLLEALKPVVIVLIRETGF
ncbi:site-2 protease family protein, partial [Craterilacuibacter sp.]|uniref:site-2 protease family protein n=1 Tax=Craterilacuibacter sp. TaxID=2870909 RepID=UPI003F2C8848